MRNLIFIVFTLAGAAFIFFQMFNFLFGVRANRGRFRKELKSLNDLLSDRLELLAPWEESKLELLSIDFNDISTSRGFNKTITGVIQNIYHEPIISFAYRCYFGNDKNALIVARTTDHEFVYALGKKNIKLWRDGEVLGLIDHDGSLFTTQGKLDVKLLQENSLSLLPLSIQGEKVAGLNNPANDFAGNNRALQLFKNLNEEETNKILAVSILELMSYEII